MPAFRTLAAALAALTAVLLGGGGGGVDALRIDRHHEQKQAGSTDVDLDALSKDLFHKFESAKVHLISLGGVGGRGSSSASDDNDCGDPCAASQPSSPPSSAAAVHFVPMSFGGAQRGYPSSQAGVGPLAVGPYAAQMQVAQQLQQQQLMQQRARMLGVGFNAAMQQQQQQQQQLGVSALLPPPTASSPSFGPSVIPMGPLTAGFAAPVLPGVALAAQIQMQAARQRQLAALQALSSGGAGGLGGGGRRAASPVSADTAKDQAETIAKLANLTKAVQSARNNLTLASWRLQAAEGEKGKRETAALEKNIEVFKMKAGVAALTDKIEAVTADAEALKAGVDKASAKVTKAQKLEEKAKAAFMDATEELVDAKMAARQGGRQRAAVGMDVGSGGDDNAMGGGGGGGGGARLARAAALAGATGGGGGGGGDGGVSAAVNSVFGAGVI